MPAQRVLVHLKNNHQFLYDHQQSLMRKNQNLREKLFDALAERAKAEHKLMERPACCDTCKRTPDISYIRCHHVFCDECFHSALQIDEKNLGYSCRICAGPEITQLAPSSGMVIMNNGQGWIAMDDNHTQHGEDVPGGSEGGDDDSETELGGYMSGIEDVEGAEEGNLTDIEEASQDGV